MAQSTGEIEGVADTAFWIAHHRAAETARADALFSDPLASLLAGEHGKAIAAAMPAPSFTAWIVAIRTVIIDDFIRRLLDEGVETILNLGAGLDTRPYRMELPRDLTWIEVDYPHVIALKEERLAAETPRCTLQRVKLDLADAPQRRALFAGIDARAKKTLVLTEGVVPYLSNEEAGALADDLRAMQHVAYWVVDYHSPATIRQRSRRLQRQMRNAPFKFTPGDWRGFFAGHGWRCQEIRYLAEEADRLNRRLRLPLPVLALWTLRGLFAARAQRARFRKAAGFALLTPQP